jgi:hypothetical protein
MSGQLWFNVGQLVLLPLSLLAPTLHIRLNRLLAATVQGLGGSHQAMCLGISAVGIA